MLTTKLEDFVEKTKQKKMDKQMHPKDAEKDQFIKAKENELKQSQNKIQFYKKEIEAMRRQLEGSYNIQKYLQCQA